MEGGGGKSERESVWDEADISEKLLYTFHQGFVILWWMFIPFCKSGPIKSETARLMIPCLIPLNFSVLLKTVTKCRHGEANYLSPVAVGVWYRLQMFARILDLLLLLLLRKSNHVIHCLEHTWKKCTSCL